MTCAIDIDALQHLSQTQTPKQRIKAALAQWPNCAIAFSGAEDVVLIDLATKVSSSVQVFVLDTGRLHPQTYRFIDQVRQHYHLSMDILSPDAAQLQAFVREKGLYSFYDEGHGPCCDVRKIAPLTAKLAQLDAWISGQRRDQSPSTRTAVPLVHWDDRFSGAQGPLLKFNPLADWSSAQVWEYIRMFDVPFNPLHQQGFISIGCEPCTRAVLPNQHEREGRWWWEEATAKECGLHQANVIARSE